MVTDPIADLLTRIRNANMAYHDLVEVPASRLKQEIVKTLHEEGFIRGYAEDEKIFECAECGTSISEEKVIMKEIEGEKYAFCSKSCTEEFEESIAPGS